MKKENRISRLFHLLSYTEEIRKIENHVPKISQLSKTNLPIQKSGLHHD